jgi:hypothetical protein
MAVYRRTISQLSNAAKKNIVANNRTLVESSETLSDTSIDDKDSFLYRASGPLTSTQQLKVDWSDFSNHVFFSSAEVATNVAFNKIINQFPFDGTRAEYDRYIESLTGYEKYVLDQFPKNTGYINFDGSSYIVIKDSPGYLLPEVSKKNDAYSVIDPLTGSFTLEFYIRPTSAANDVQCVFQKFGNGSNISVMLSQSAGSTVTLAAAVAASSKSTILTHTLTKGEFTHIALVHDKDESKLRLYADGEISTESVISFDNINTLSADVTIGTGSAVTALVGTGNPSPFTITPVETLSGSIDELRFYRTARSTHQIKSFMNRGVFSETELVLYYKFNEPFGQIMSSSGDAYNAVVLDSSGYSHHALITNYTSSLRLTSSSPPLRQEKSFFNPVLFPNYSGVTTLNSTLLTSGSEYDRQNPNLITRLIPPHYLIEGQAFDGLQTIDGTIVDTYIGNNVPGTGKLGSTQLLLGLLYSYAKYFDELKLYVDSFANLSFIDYDEYDTAPDIFIRKYFESKGFSVPNIFENVSIEQYVDGYNVNDDGSNSDYSIREIEASVLRRIATALPEIISSRGTLHSVKAFLRSVGIDPDSSLKIREHGGAAGGSIRSARDTNTTLAYYVNVTGSNALLKSQYLSGTRREVGWPQIAGTFANTASYPPHGASNQLSDGLQTSGSWTCELSFWYPFTNQSSISTAYESIARLCTTGSNSSNGGVWCNVLAGSGSYDVKMYIAGDASYEAGTVRTHMLYLTGCNVFDGDRWYLSFGRVRGDQDGASTLTSSYFLRVAKTNDGKVFAAHATSSLYAETLSYASASFNQQQSISSSFNASGSYFAVGAGQQMQTGATADYTFLNNTSSPSTSRIIACNARLGELRFWSKYLSQEEWYDHVRSHESFGVDDPRRNYNYNNDLSGSFGKLRLHSLTRNEVTSSDSLGAISFYDYSEHGTGVTGSGFDVSSKLVYGEHIVRSRLTPKFDQNSNADKVRIRSMLDQRNIDYESSTWVHTAPLNEIPKSETPTDSTKVTIELSVVDALDRDIINAMSDYSLFETALGSIGNQNFDSYPELEQFATVYFNRLKSKIDFKQYLDYYTWINSSIGEFIKQIMPRKASYRGIDYVIEPNALERAKVRYSPSEHLFSDGQRFRTRDLLLVQQIVGIVKKY